MRTQFLMLVAMVVVGYATVSGQESKTQSAPAQSQREDPLVEYEPGSTFSGVVGRTVEESSPAWPAMKRAKEGTPNVLVFVVDDVGFGQMSVFGGLVPTPNIDKLADNGLRYTNAHVTATCSPTRSCILTGRNSHSNGFADIPETATGFPGYNCRIPSANGTIAELLRNEGFNTFALGKWHLVPSEEASAAGPFDRWPTGKGFERYYGYLGGETNQFYPDLVEGNTAIRPPYTPEQGYHLNVDLADHAIQYILDSHVNAPDKPFFLYYATGGCHAPHHAPKELIAKYKGKFDMGWDEYREMVFARQLEMGLLPSGTTLPPHDPDVPRWETLTADEKKLYARFMEVFAAYLEHTDRHFGRILNAIEKTGELDNTLVMVITDNGASTEGGLHGSFNEMSHFNFLHEEVEDILPRMDQLGGPHSHCNYPWGWAWAGDTPFRRWKRETYKGGTAVPLVVHWPTRIKAKGEIRRQYVHAIDLLPTILDSLGLRAPTTLNGVIQSPIEGVSFAHTFNEAKAPSRHTTQYYETQGHRSIYHDGWRAVCPYPGPSFKEAVDRGRKPHDPITPKVLDQLDANEWELYNVAVDPAESKNVAQEHPDKLRELVTRWWTEAGKYHVLPLDPRDAERIATVRPQISKPRNRFVFLPNGSPVPAFVAPKVYNRSHTITASVDIPKGGAEGVLVSHGGHTGGYSLYLKDGRLHYVHNYVSNANYEVKANQALTPGRHELRFEFEVTGEGDIPNGKGTPGNGRLFIDGTLVGEKEIPITTPNIFGLIGLSCGYDCGDGVTDAYHVPFTFTGKIDSVTVELK